MDFVCFKESAGVCEEVNMTHKVPNPICFLLPCQKQANAFERLSVYIAFVYEKHFPLESDGVLPVTYYFIAVFIFL